MHYDESLVLSMIHAGLPPQLDLATARTCAKEVENVLQGPNYVHFLEHMYGNLPDTWDDNLEGIKRLRFITNCLTRIRYCTATGELEFKEKLPPGTQPEHLLPWFDMPQRATSDTRVVFGHWSTLGLVMRPDIIALDTGCVCGGELTAVRLDEDRPPVQLCSGQTARFGS